MREWPGKSQQEIAAQVGCSQGLVARYKGEFITSNKLNPPPIRTGKDGKQYPTAHATRTTSSATFNPLPAGCAKHRLNHCPRRCLKHCREQGAGDRMPGPNCWRLARGCFQLGRVLFPVKRHRRTCRHRERGTGERTSGKDGQGPGHPPGHPQGPPPRQSARHHPHRGTGPDPEPGADGRRRQPSGPCNRIRYGPGSRRNPSGGGTGGATVRG